MFNYNGGAISGNTPVLLESALNLSSTQPATFALRGPNSGGGTGTLSGNVAPGQTILIQSNAVTMNVTAATGFINQGTIVLEALAAGRRAWR